MSRATAMLPLLAALALPALASLAAPPPALHAQQVVDEEISTEYQKLRLVRVAGGLEHPWAVAPLPDGRLLVTERPGRLLLIDGESRTEVTGVPTVHARNQGGLLDVTLHPDFATNGWIYLTYSKADGDMTTTALARARLDGSRLADMRDIFVTNARGQPGGHYGSRVVFLDDGTLLMSVGDRMRQPERAQDTRDHAGSIVRLTADGSVPQDNPFVGNDAFAPEIYSFGHRNIQAMTRHAGTGEVWVFEHGPRGSDLLHRISAGRNYGWPDVTPGRHYQDQRPFSETRESAAVAGPVHEFVITLAPSGLTAVNGGAWHSTWQGNLLGGALRGERMIRMVIEDGVLVHAEELLLGTIGRIRDVRMAGNGNIYVVTDHEDGGLYRIEPVAGT
jgi:aldose sugar dehydrogenase